MNCTATTPRPTLTVGQIITNDRPFTNLIGVHFLAGERFEVVAVDRNTRCEHLGSGSVVWLRGSTEGAKFAVEGS